MISFFAPNKVIWLPFQTGLSGLVARGLLRSSFLIFSVSSTAHTLLTDASAELVKATANNQRSRANILWPKDIRNFKTQGCMVVSCRIGPQNGRIETQVFSLFTRLSYQKLLQYSSRITAFHR